MEVRQGGGRICVHATQVQRRESHMGGGAILHAKLKDFQLFCLCAPMIIKITDLYVCAHPVATNLIYRRFRF